MVKLRSLLVGLFTALQISPLVGAKGLFEPSSDHALVARQAAVGGTLCETTDIGILGINIASGVCICIEAGVITPASLTRINTLVTVNSGILAVPLRLLGGVAGVTTRIVSTLVPVLLETGTDCTYPANATPNECGGCGYACKSNSTVTYVSCGNYCVLPGTTCVSGIPQSARRRHLSRNSLNRCSFGYEACRVPGTPRQSLVFECIDTANDLEACGGCVVPFAGRPTGTDCSALPHVASASCEQGSCNVHACEKGYELEGNECVEADKVIPAGFWEGLQSIARLEAI